MMENDHGVLTRTVVWTDVSTTYAEDIFRVKKSLSVCTLNVENKGRKKKKTFFELKVKHPRKNSI